MFNYLIISLHVVIELVVQRKRINIMELVKNNNNKNVLNM